jgi:hypothetical protein
MSDEIPRFIIEATSEQVHQDWIKTKLSQGVSTRLSETGEELMVPYRLLSEDAKNLDRNTVKAVLKGLEAAGYTVVYKGV